MLNKSLLMLLKEEHGLVLDMKYNRETCEMLKISNNKKLLHLNMKENKKN